MRDPELVVKAVSGLIVAYGPLDPRVQKVILAHCKRGGAEVMKEVVAECMLDRAVEERKVPLPVGIKTKDLVDRTSSAIVELCRDYLQNGGVLVARKYVPLEDLYSAMLKFWHIRFMKPIKESPSVIDGMPQAEVVARLAIAAQAARQILLSYGMIHIGEGETARFVPEAKLEEFCMRVAKATYEGFHRPEQMVHNMIHGDNDEG